jgi:hypothetical protein
VRPRGIPGWYVKIRPWYYTERSSVPARAAELAVALAYEEAAMGPDDFHGGSGCADDYDDHYDGDGHDDS